MAKSHGCQESGYYLFHVVEQKGKVLKEWPTTSFLREWSCINSKVSQLLFVYRSRAIIFFTNSTSVSTPFTWSCMVGTTLLSRK